MRKVLSVALTAAALAASGTSFAEQLDPGSRTPGNLNASITLEQKQRIRAAVFEASNAPRIARVDFSLTIGNVVPASVPIAPVPDPVAKAFPDWRRYAYFVVHDEIQDQIIIVDPRDRTIVAIIA